MNLIYHPERRIEVEWDRPGPRPTPSGWTCRSRIEKGILADVSTKIAGINTNITNVEATTNDQIADAST